MSSKFDDVMKSIVETELQSMNDSVRNQGVEKERKAKEGDAIAQSEELWKENLATFRQNVHDINATLAEIGLTLIEEPVESSPMFGVRLKVNLKRDKVAIGELLLGLTPTTGMVSFNGRDLQRGSSPAKSQSLNVTEFAGENGKIAIGIFIKDILDRGRTPSLRTK